MKRSITLLFFVAASIQYGAAQPPTQSIREMASTADKIFMGDCASINYIRNDKGLPLTVVNFIHAVQANSTAKSAEIIYAGGQASDTFLAVSNTPTFTVGQTYMVFAAENDKGYFNPVLAPNGSMKVIRDQITGDRFLLSADNRLISISEDQLIAGGPAISSIKQRIPVYKGSSNPWLFEQRAVSSDGTTPAPPYVPSSTPELLLLDDLLNLLSAYGMQLDHTSLEKLEIPDTVASKSTGQQVSYCGFQNLKINITQVPTSFIPWYSLNNDAMWIWNQYMDLFRYLPSSGVYGQNRINEFGGFPTTANLTSAYGNGFGWSPNTLAMTIVWSSAPCGQIVETDIFANPNARFTDNIWSQVNGQAIMYRATMLHELGHVWGLMNGAQEKYDYDVPTAMHGGSNVYEDGWGIHCADANLIRRDYSNQTPVITAVDLGVESYYAQSGLHTSGISTGNLVSGNPVNIQGFTVENMSSAAVSNMQLHFYLSMDNVVNSLDYAFPGYYYWNSFPAEQYHTDNYSLVVPYNIPSGYYYIGADISYNGGQKDNFVPNNSTIIPRQVYVQGISNAVVGSLPTEEQISIAYLSTPNQYLLQCKENNGAIIIRNMDGKVIKTQDLADKVIRLETAEGLYFVEVRSSNGTALLKLAHHSR